MLLGARQFFERRGAPTPPLPYDAEVEYLESTGTQWIDTGVYGRDGIRISAVATRDLSASTGNRYIFGVAQSIQTFTYVTVNVVSGVVTTGLYSIPASTSSGIVTDDLFHSYLIDTTSGSKYASVDGATIRELATSGSGQTSLTIGLFGSIVGTAFKYSSCRIASFSIKDTTTDQLIIDLIPVRFTNEQGVSEGAMYDRVSGALFRNAGSGAFLIGPDKS